MYSDPFVHLMIYFSDMRFSGYFSALILLQYNHVASFVGRVGCSIKTTHQEAMQRREKWDFKMVKSMQTTPLRN